MKKIFVLALVLCLIGFVLGGCGEKATVTQDDESGEPEPEMPATTSNAGATKATQPKEAMPDIGALTQDGMDCLEPGVRVCLPVNYVIAKKGDTVGFAFGVSNQFPETKRVTLKLKFVRTQQDLGTLAVEVDKDYMNNWLAVNDIDTYYNLEPDEKLSKPILIKIQDYIGEGKATEAGAYVFEVQAQTYENGFYDDYGGAQQVTVRVK